MAPTPAYVWYEMPEGMDAWRTHKLVSQTVINVETRFVMEQRVDEAGIKYGIARNLDPDEAPLETAIYPVTTPNQPELPFLK